MTTAIKILTLWKEVRECRVTASFTSWNPQINVNKRLNGRANQPAASPSVTATFLKSITKEV